MAADARLVIAVAGEDEVHRSMVLDLGRRVTIERARDIGASWLTDPNDVLSFAHPFDDQRDFYAHKTARDDLRRLLGKPEGAPLYLTDAAALRGCPHAIAIADVIRIVERCGRTVQVLVVLRDTDGDDDACLAPDRVQAWFAQQDRRLAAVVCGLPHQDAEAWIVLGLANDPSIARQRAQAKKQLSFDPCANPEGLTAAPNDADTDAKRVLRFLLGQTRSLSDEQSRPVPRDEHRELLERAFADLKHLERHGAGCQIAPFLSALRREVATRAVPGPPPT